MLRRTFLSRSALAVAATALAVTPFASAHAQRRGPDRDRPGTWELLGSQKVNFGIDRDKIRVGRRDGRFRAIKIRVLENDIEMLDLRVIYANGAPDDIPIRQLFRAGSESRTIDLKGNTRFIHEIQMVYRTRPKFRGRATVQIYGLH